MPALTIITNDETDGLNLVGDIGAKNGEWERKECAELEKSTGMTVNKSKY